MPTHPKADEALAWMGFEARQRDPRGARPGHRRQEGPGPRGRLRPERADVVSRLEKLGDRLQDHHRRRRRARRSRLRRDAGGEAPAGSAGDGNVKRQHMGKLQHNKTIVVDGPKVQAVVCGSTNFTWRGFFVQANNAVSLRGASAVKPFLAAFDDYWATRRRGRLRQDGARRSGPTSACTGIDAQVAFSPHSAENALLADDRRRHRHRHHVEPVLLAGVPVPDARARSGTRSRRSRRTTSIFVYGISDQEGRRHRPAEARRQRRAGVSRGARRRTCPEPFKSRADRRRRATACTTSSSSSTSTSRPRGSTWAPTTSRPRPTSKNGENLLLIRDRRIAVSYVVEALRIFDHYHFRVAQQEARRRGRS